MDIDSPVLEKLLKKTNSSCLFKKTLFICVQHLLFTNIDLFKAMIHLGALPNNIYILGKIYSTNLSAEKLLHNMGIHIASRHNQDSGLTSFREAFDADILSMMDEILYRRGQETFDAIIILDDGGHCIKNYYQSVLFENFKNVPIMGVEQTSSGLRFLQKPDYSTIEVASSALKQEVESLFIANAIVKKCQGIFENRNKTFSVIGLGVIGRSLANLLIDFGFTVFTYDIDKIKNTSFSRGITTQNIKEAFLKGDYIFGCTGKDITEKFNVNDSVLSNKVLISCSSGDNEFKSLLENVPLDKNNVLSDLKIAQSNGKKITILGGGFPINLDTSGYSVKACDIQLTRALLLGGLIQAMLIIKSRLKPSKQLMLDPFLQFFILQEWKKVGSMEMIHSPVVHKFFNVAAIKSKSGGTFFPLSNLQHLFYDTDPETVKKVTQ